MHALGVEAHVVCEELENLDQFSVDNIHCLGKEPTYRQLLKQGLFAKVRRKLRTSRIVMCSISICRLGKEYELHASLSK
jgi:hypothetical protein